MTSFRVACLLLGGILIGVLGAGEAAAQTAACQALLKKRDAECQEMAEKMQAVCPAGQGAGGAAQSAECRKLGQQLANHCNRNPCRAAPRKAKSRKARAKKAKRSAMGKAVKSKSSKAKSAKPKSPKTKSSKPRRPAAK